MSNVCLCIKNGCLCVCLGVEHRRPARGGTTVDTWSGNERGKEVLKPEGRSARQDCVVVYKE